MKKKRISTILVLVMLLVSVFSSTMAWAAANNDTIDPQSIVTCTKSFIATSSTKAKATVSASSSGNTPYITSKITLQSAALGSTRFSNVSNVDPDIYTVEDKVAILHQCTFPITSSKEYRIKIEITDEVNGITTTKTYYQELSR
ncbi:MAG: hypothetical protein HFG67_03290 [Firmicutes bacterium]|nr:hypothetical protein [Bacillota bacterium]